MEETARRDTVKPATRRPVFALPSLSLSESQRIRVIRVWHRYRMPFAGALLVAVLVLAVGVRWRPGFIVAVLPLLAIVDSRFHLRRRSFDAPWSSMVIDVTSVFLAFGLADLRDAALGIPFAYVVVSALLLLPPMVALLVVAYAGVWFTALVYDWIPFAPISGEGTAILLASLADLVFSLALIGLMGMVMSIINRESERRERRIRLEHALAEFSATLLDPSLDDPLKRGLDLLVVATEAGAVFVQRNVEHPDLGLCSTIECEATHMRAQPRPPGMWDTMPWSTLPEAQAELSDGRPHVYDLERLSPDMRRRFEESNIRSEIAFPIFVDGAWYGVVGFDDIDADHIWSTSDRVLLQTAAQILGTYFQRVDARIEREGHVARLDLQRRYEAALGECSRVLLTSTEEGALDGALHALLRASEADYAYIDLNYDDPEMGLCTKIAFDASSGEGVDAEEEWWGGPYRQLPTSLAALSRGEAVTIITSELRGRERLLYERDGVKAELCIPLHVNDQWVGSIAFADYRNERTWAASEVRALRTAAEMIGAFWERRDAKTRLEELVDSLNLRLTYEEALSRCSQALLQSLDDSAIDSALEALRAATKAHNVFLDVNFDDPNLGLCARVTHEVVRPGFEDIVAPERWLDPDTGVPQASTFTYGDIPWMQAQLASGQPAVVNVASLPTAEQEPYRDDPVKTELNIPIFVEGMWWGSIGFADYVRERAWPDDEIALLRTAAEMFGAFWERRGARTRLEKLVEAKDEFVAAVSHELRTPLTTVVGLSHELRNRRADFTGQEHDDFIHLIAEQSAEVANIVEDLLVAARSNTGTLVVNPGEVDVAAEVWTVLEADVDLHRRLSIEVRGACRAAWVDAGRLRQIIRNLLTNADRYGGDHAWIVLADTSDGVVVAVEDDGSGVPEDQQETIFEPYARAHTARTQPASVGLGLAVARSLARLMGGDLVHSRRNGRTAFEVHLLAADARTAADAMAPPI